MSWLGAKWRFWVELFDRKELGTSLAIVRVGVALALLYSLLSPVAFDIVCDLFCDRDFGGMRRVSGAPLLTWLGGATPANVWMLYGASLALTLCLFVGVGGRLTSFLLLQTYGAIVTANPYASGAYDFLFTSALWLLVLGDGTRTLSVDCYRRRRAWTSSELVSAWPRYLFLFQLIVMYTSTGLHKNSVVWLPTGGYSALYYALMDPNWTRFQFDLVAWVYPVTQLLSALTVHWEQATVLLLLVFYFRYTRSRSGRLRSWFNHWDLRKPWAAIGVGLHAGVLVAFNVGPFSWISLAYYPALLSGAESTELLHRLKRRLPAMEP